MPIQQWRLPRQKRSESPNQPIFGRDAPSALNNLLQYNGASLPSACRRHLSIPSLQVIRIRWPGEWYTKIAKPETEGRQLLHKPCHRAKSHAFQPLRRPWQKAEPQLIASPAKAVSTSPPECKSGRCRHRKSFLDALLHSYHSFPLFLLNMKIRWKIFSRDFNPSVGK